MTIATMNGTRAAFELEEELYEGSRCPSPQAATLEGEADPFSPLLPVAAKALPMVANVALPAVRRLVPSARQAAGRVFRSVIGRGGAGPVRRRRVRRRRPPSARGWPSGGAFTPAQQATVSRFFRQLSQTLAEGELMAAQAEAELFGINEFQPELASHERAHDAALTEVLAAEAAHAANESEAEALLGSALPITVRIMGANRALQPVYPTLTHANSRLVRGIRRSSSAGSQLLRLVPCAQRYAVASLLALQRAGRPITPQLAVRILAGQAARVMRNPRICGRALLRNTAIRQGTVASVGGLRRGTRFYRPQQGRFRS